jgi:hypothetical protein
VIPGFAKKLIGTKSESKIKQWEAGQNSEILDDSQDIDDERDRVDPGEPEMTDE